MYLIRYKLQIYVVYLQLKYEFLAVYQFKILGSGCPQSEKSCYGSSFFMSCHFRILALPKDEFSNHAFYLLVCISCSLQFQKQD